MNLLEIHEVIVVIFYSEKLPIKIEKKVKLNFHRKNKKQFVLTQPSSNCFVRDTTRVCKNFDEKPDDLILYESPFADEYVKQHFIQ